MRHQTFGIEFPNVSSEFQVGSKLTVCLLFTTRLQGCPMVYFQTQNPNLGKFSRVLQLKMLVYFMAIWPILLPVGIHIVWPFGIFLTIWYTYFSRFGMLHQEKSGNPCTTPKRFFFCFDSWNIKKAFLESRKSPAEKFQRLDQNLWWIFYSRCRKKHYNCNTGFHCRGL
jgi:hypothetical protein